MSMFEIWLIYAIPAAIFAWLKFGINEGTKSKFLHGVREVAEGLLLLIAVPTAIVTLMMLFNYDLNPTQSTSNSSNSSSSSMSDIPEDTEDASTEPDDTQSFMGYDCSSDCSGHEAGYDWAEENDICESDYSESNSQSFDEGVEAYVEENC